MAQSQDAMVQSHMGSPDQNRMVVPDQNRIWY